MEQHEPVDLALGVVRPGGARLEYHHGPHMRTPYVHPVEVEPGFVFTNMRPSDHRWHRGVWATFKYVNGVNFWEQRDAPDEPQGRHVVLATSVAAEARHAAAVAQALEWRAFDGDVAHLMEERRVRLDAAPAAGAAVVEWDTTLTAARDTVIDRTDPEEHDWGGYGGMNIRPSRAVWATAVLLDSEGRTARADVHCGRSRWAAVAGNPDGSDDAASRVHGVALLDHPANPDHPVRFQALRGLTLSTMPVYDRPLRLAEGEHVRFRWQVVFFTGAPDATALDAAWAAFAAA